MKEQYNNLDFTSNKYKGVRVSDRELRKWGKILGVKKIILLYMEDKIELTPEQLDDIIKMKNMVVIKCTK